MKKTLASIFVAVCLAVTSVFALSACNNRVAKALNVKETYKMGITAGVSYLKENSSASPKLLSSVSGSSETTGSASSSLTSTTLARPSAIENEINSLNEYVTMFEGYLADNTQNSVATSPDIASEIGKTFGTYSVDEHTIKMVFSVPKIDGTSETYTVYYTETLADNSGYVEADDEDEQEVNATLSGVAIAGEDIYSLSGTRKTETEIDEIECELNFTISKDAKNYIKMEYSTETETDEQENEFKFSVVSDGVLTSKTSIEFETEDNESEMKLKFIGADASKVVYKFKDAVKDGKNIIIVKYTADAEKGTIEISLENGVYTYSYSNGFTETITK